MTDERKELSRRIAAIVAVGFGGRAGAMVTDTMEAIDIYTEGLEETARREAVGCPCTIIEPCSYACTCARSGMSGGCQRCARYGSKEQRESAANRIAIAIKAHRG